MSNHHLIRHGLKWNPFTPDIPTEGCHRTPMADHFLWRVENLARTGGFAMVSGEPGTGKSVLLRLLLHHLNQQPDLTVAILTRPQGSVPDFYREMGALFGVPLSPHNRWGGAKVLRERWLAHIEISLVRAVLIIDEAQSMHAAVLNELRLLCADRLDSRTLLTVILSGDGRLQELLASKELTPLGSRIRVRMRLESLPPNEIAAYLRHVLVEAGNPNLMSEQLCQTLSERAAGNLRILMNIASELLEAAIHQEVNHIDERLYLELFSPPLAAHPKPNTHRGCHP